MNSILKIFDLKIGYKNSKAETVVAQDISFSLERGKLVALVGANGIGKSTLLKTILGFENPIEGTILLNDKNISEIPPKELARYISVVLTEKLPPSNLSVYELIALGRQPYTGWVGELSDIDKEKIKETIALTRLHELINNKHYKLSDGQLQKTMIARALAQDTEMMVLDEPTTHLDLLHKISVFKLLKKLSEQTQKCVLFSTHDIDMAIEFCDEIIVMTPEKTQKDTPQNLIENGIFDKLFSSESIIFDKKIKRFVYV